MMPPNNKPSFLDRGTIIALLVVTAFWMAWTAYMDKKYPKPPPGTAQHAQQTAPAVGSDGKTLTPAEQAAPPAATSATAVAPATSAPETFTDFDSPNLAFQLSSRGMGVKNINIKSYQTRDDKPIIMGDVPEKYPMATAFTATDTPIDFAVERSGNVFTGRAAINGMNIVKTMKVDPDRYAIDTEIQITGAGADFKGFTTYLSEPVSKHHKKGFFGFLAPAFDTQDFLSVHDDSRTQHMIVRKDGLNVAEKNVSLLALSSHYFTMALVDRSQVLPRFEATLPAESPDVAEPANMLAVGRLVHAPVSPVADFNVKYTAYTGPKSLSSLTAVDEQLSTVINYGMFSWIAKPLLWLLKFLYSFFHNYGVAIIFLTIIVRLIVLPFNVYSFKSMKVMQKLQPEMQRLRERYKSDPPTMNREIMELMKRNKANPLGGCLPMLLQLPVFLALYQVLGQSIELYRAPFMLWIQDLSTLDHWYVLPALMTVTMWVQQKITPTTMDPQQAKILQWMPLIFGFMMISLPSGLTLYIFVSTLFGIIQQYLFMREKTPNANVSHAQA